MCTMRRMTVLCAMKVSILCFILSLGEQFKLETPSGDDSDELPTKVLNITSHDTVTAS